MQLSEILTYAGIALVVALVYNMSNTNGEQNRSMLVIVAMIILVVLAYMLMKDKDATTPGKRLAHTKAARPGMDVVGSGFDQDSQIGMVRDDEDRIASRLNNSAAGYQSYDEYGQEPYTDVESLQNMQTRMDAIVPNTMRGEGFRDVPTGNPATPERKEQAWSGFKPFLSTDVEYAMPMAKKHNVASPAMGTSDKKAVHGNYLDVSSKEANTHGQVGTNSALLPIMEQYMKVHENDPTRTSIWQSNNGVPSYDLRDPINVKLNDFPRTVSAKLPVV